MNMVLYVLGAVALLGGAIAALPPIWKFVKAAARVPFVLEQVSYEFSPNSGHSMRDSINRLEDGVEEISGQLGTHMVSDAETFAHLLATLRELADLRTVLVQPTRLTLGDMNDLEEK